MVSLVNDNVTRISFVLFGIAIVLLLISVTLINNTIRVSIYANRFIINTMKLVGATFWFIRKPYIIRGVINGVLASILAMILLFVMNFYISTETGISLMTLNNAIGFKVGLIVFLTGILISALSSYFSVGRYLNMKTEDMYLA
jgi:cell division transport system permease protein